MVDVPEVVAAIGTTIGNVRSENQDRAIVARLTNKSRSSRSLLICIVCDGMGGMTDGGRCAEIAIAAFLESMLALQSASDNALRNAAIQANNAVYSAYKGQGGTTLAAIVLGPPNRSAGITIGDSRLYVFSTDDGLRQVSIDDTIAGELQRLRGTKANEPRSDDFANRLAQFVGIGDGLEPRIYDLGIIKSATSYLLSSDGVHNISAQILQDVITYADSRYLAISRIVQLSRWCGGKDNASAVSIQANGYPSSEDTKEKEEVRIEVWDSFGKLDLVWSESLQLNDRPDPQYKLPVLEQETTTKFSESKKGSSTAGYTKRKRNRKPASKEHPEKSREKAERRGPRGELEIEIVDSSKSTEQVSNEIEQKSPDQKDDVDIQKAGQ